MKPPPFAYVAPTNVAEAVDLLAKYGSEARILAGGQSLVPLMNLRMARPEIVIDLNRCAELRGIERGAAGVSYGAMVRQIDAERSAVTRGGCPLVAEALAQAGPIAVRSRATVGGTIAHADRAAELPGVAIALNATMLAASKSGMREIAAEEFFLGDMTTAMTPEEMLHTVVFPIEGARVFSSFVEVGLRREGVAIVGLAASVAFGAGAAIADARLALIGVEPSPVRVKSAEAMLKDQPLTPALIAEAGELAYQAVDPISDAQATAAYRKSVARSLIEGALREAMTRARH